MTDGVQREELAAFLRSRREATDPGALGLLVVGRRRTPGLRREELSQLAGVSVSWYTWLEQARDIGVSRQVIDNLARVLRMEPTERAHLFTLAGLSAPSETMPRQEVDETLRRLTTTLQPNPAYVVNRWWDILAYNDAYAALVGGIAQLPPKERNTLWLMFTDARVRGLHVDWRTTTYQMVGEFRVNLAQHCADVRGRELLDALKAVSPDFNEIWGERRIRCAEPGARRIRHHAVGRLDLDYIKLAAADDQHLIAFLPADDESATKLRSLC